MCGMCESHVNEAIRNKFDIKKVTASRKDGEAVIISEAELSETELSSVISETGYKVLGIKKEPYVKKGIFGFGK